MLNILTEILMFSVLSGGVSCSKGCCRRFGRIFENVDYLKSSTPSSLKRCRWFQIIDMLNYRQISPNRNCSTLAIPWCFYKISRAFDGFSTSIIWQKYHPPELKHRPIFRLVWARTGLNLLHGANFQRFLSGKSVFLNSKFQIREFHAYWMDWGEVLER